MGNKVWMQCAQCGHLHKVKETSVSDDDLYTEEYCPRCRDETKHLWCGENETDIYIYYNANLDPRYY